MYRIFVYSQNVKLDSFENIHKRFGDSYTNIFITPHYVFDNERDYLMGVFGDCIFKCFADYLSDNEMEECDVLAYESEDMLPIVYQDNIRSLKNGIIVEKVVDAYRDKDCCRIILSNDLGIDITKWKKAGFKPIKADYYHVDFKMLAWNMVKKSDLLIRIYKSIPKKMKYRKEDVHVGYYEGRKYVFLGSLNRIEYRLNIELNESKEECLRLNRGYFDDKDTCTYVTTWHEHFKCRIPDDDRYAVRWAQDGYLPANYSHYDYEFKPGNVVYYCWDVLGTQLFRNRKLPYEIIPFRKKLYIPEPKFPDKVKNVLIAASGSGDWTALKNRSDDDMLVVAFAKMAKKYPDIRFVYRCHPTWIHPNHLGVNSINRVREYFDSLKLDNLTVSGNIPGAGSAEGFRLSFSRSTLDEDLKNADIVFGEHSISMIDAAFKGIPFCAVNMTGRRSFFESINELGFLNCTSVKEIEKVIEGIGEEGMQSDYLRAVDAYNKMTDQEISNE